MEKREANMMFNKNGNGYITTRITIPVIWARQLGFTEENKKAIIELNNNKIIIKKNNMEDKSMDKSKIELKNKIIDEVVDLLISNISSWSDTDTEKAESNISLYANDYTFQYIEDNNIKDFNKDEILKIVDEVEKEYLKY